MDFLKPAENRDPSLPVCSACGVYALASEQDRQRGMCEHCANGTGQAWTLAQIPALRPAKPCARCNEPRFVRALVRERTNYTPHTTRLAPLALSFATLEQGPFAPNRRADTHAPVGLVVAYACLACGFTELYTWYPAGIPIGPEFGTELVDVSGAGPDGGPFR